MNRILGIGNALVDIMTSLTTDDLLVKLNLPKGSMQLVDDATISNALNQTKGLSQTLASGGSAANTINGLANLGVQTSFIGKVGDDDMGKFFAQDMVKNGIRPMLLEGKAQTGMALALVSPDSERTFAVNLGSAIELSPYDITQETFSGHQCLHIEGYLVQNHSLIEKALKLAKQCGLMVSLDLASYNVVEANLDFLHRMVKEYVDIVFANEEEAKAFTGKSPEESLEIIAGMTRIAVVKVGAKGSYIKSGSERYNVGVIKVNPKDTTGAGDMYASGFLFGLSQGLNLGKCGEIGAILSGKVIEVVGPKMSVETWDEIRLMVKQLIAGEKAVN
jgi:sugar/nucleoside kinase (ribokinase family)